MDLSSLPEIIRSSESGWTIKHLILLEWPFNLNNGPHRLGYNEDEKLVGDQMIIVESFEPDRKELSIDGVFLKKFSVFTKSVCSPCSNYNNLGVFFVSISFIEFIVDDDNYYYYSSRISIILMLELHATIIRLLSWLNAIALQKYVCLWLI